MRVLVLLLLVPLAACDDAMSDPPPTDDSGAPDAAASTDASVPLDGAANPDPTLPSACNTATPCGGDVVGEWVWESWCRDIDAEPVEACLAAEMTQHLTPSGTARFDADGRFTMDAEYSIERTTQLPPECIATTCANAGAELAPDRTWTCAPDEPGSDCTCRSVQVLPGDDTGSWSVDGDILTTRSDDAEADRPLWYCVDGDRLLLRDLDATGPDDPVFILRRR